MKFDKEFVVRRSAADAFALLDSDASIQSLFPDTKIVSTADGVRETSTLFSELGITRDIRFRFRARPDTTIAFEKICDGNIWRSLVGEIRLIAAGPSLTRVVLSMEGSTRTLVPEFTIKAPMREQLEQMTRSLRARLEHS